MPMPLRHPRTGLLAWGLVLPLALLAGCASHTTALLSPSPQAPVCAASASAQVWWHTAWRPDQKDVPARDAAAAQGLGQFFAGAGCFKSAEVRRVSPPPAPGATPAGVAEALQGHDKRVLIVVRELGPTVKLGASLALVEGATEVVLEVTEYSPASPAPRRFTVHWRSGGPGVIKGVASLPQDLQAALAVGLQPAPR